MTHIYLNAVLLNVLPLLDRERPREVRWEAIAERLGIPVAWVGRALKDCVANEYLVCERTHKGHECYRPNLEHDEMLGCSEKNTRVVGQLRLGGTKKSRPRAPLGRLGAHGVRRTAET